MIFTRSYIVSCKADNMKQAFKSSDISNKISYQVTLLDDRAPTSSVLGHNSTGVIWKRMGILHTDIISLCYQMTHMLFSTLVCGSRNGVSCHSPNNRTPLAREDILKMILCTCDSDQPCKSKMVLLQFRWRQLFS